MSALVQLPGPLDAPGIAAATVRGETRLLTTADLGALVALQHDIVDRAPWGTVARETTGFLASHLGAEGYTVGLFCSGRLIAYGILGLSSAAQVRLGGLLGLTAEQCGRLAVLDGVGVSPTFRGRGIHDHLNSVRGALADQHGRRLIAATAAPANPASWHNLMRFGLEIRGLARMFGDHWRYLMLREESPARAESPAEFVAALDVVRQQRLLALGWRGVRPGDSRDRPTVGYLAGDRSPR
jgi:hypothetical protein